MGAEQSQEMRIAQNEKDLEDIARLIDSSLGHVVVLCGAGLSTSADFRSPKTGLYANLERFNLPYPEAVFDIGFFRNNPEPFYLLARELYPGKYIPTISHAFLALLSEKGKLRMLFTQNIDCLERAAGIPSDKIIEAHGSFATQRCIECKLEYPEDLMKVAIESAKVPRCSENPNRREGIEDCDGLVKPDIVFFGEGLPEAFFRNTHIASEADLMLIIGTSLTVQPFASLPLRAREDVPRVLFNMEVVGNIGSRDEDICVLGPCDDGIRKLADALGWTSEMEEKWVEMGGVKNMSTKAPATLEDEIDQITNGVGEAKLSEPVEEKQETEGVAITAASVEEKQKTGGLAATAASVAEMGGLSKSSDPVSKDGVEEKPSESTVPSESSAPVVKDEVEEKPSEFTTPSESSESVVQDEVEEKSLLESTAPSSPVSSETTLQPVPHSNSTHLEIQAPDSSTATQESSAITSDESVVLSKKADSPKKSPVEAISKKRQDNPSNSEDSGIKASEIKEPDHTDSKSNI